MSSENSVHRIRSGNDEDVAAVHHEAESDRWIFFCHGFGSNKEGSYESRAEKAVEEGFNAVRFDFRGNGESDGDFIDQSLSSKIRDIEAVIDYFEPDSYIVFGSSFGGKVALHFTAENDPEAVIGRAPVTYNSIMDKYRSVVEEKGEFTHHEGATIDEGFYEDLDTYSFEECAGKIDVPVFIFHGAADSTVHIENSVEALGELETDVFLQKFEGEKHSFSVKAEQKMQETLFNCLKNI